MVSADYRDSAELDGKKLTYESSKFSLQKTSKVRTHRLS